MRIQFKDAEKEKSRLLKMKKQKRGETNEKTFITIGCRNI